MQFMIKHLSLSMDFVYLSFTLLLSVTLCMGQTAEPPKFEVKLMPEVRPIRIAIGASSVVTCLVSPIGDAEPPNMADVTFEWSKEGVPITNEDSSMSPHIMVQSSRYILVLDPVTESDAGPYKCTVTVTGGASQFKEAHLEIFEPLNVEADPEQFGIKGQDGKVNCKATSQPPPEVSWKGPSGNIKSSSEKYILSQGMLTVKNLEFADGGEYKCVVTEFTSGVFKTYKINFEVVELPVISGVLGIEPINAKVGDDARITCKAEGTPPPTYAFKRGDALMPAPQVDDISGILSLPNLQRTDEADYTCIASNRGGETEKSNRLDVLIPPTIEDIPAVPEAVAGGHTSVVCKAQGDPAPDVAWKKVGMDVNYNEGVQDGGPKIEMTADSRSDAEIKNVDLKMTFNPIKSENAGDYECTAFSTVGTVTKTVSIQVQYAPVFMAVNGDKFYGWRGHRANLTCQVDANPVARIEWKQKNKEDPKLKEEIKNEGRSTITDLRVEGHISTRSLLISIDDDASVYADYICEASNSQNVTEKVLTLTEAIAPGPPLVSLGPILSTMVTILIQKPGNSGGQSVTHYVYNYNEQSGSDTGEGEVEASDDHTKIELNELNPSTNYIINVMAKSVVGPGETASVAFETQAVSAPVRLILESPAVGDESDAYTVQWKKPNDGGTPITSYIIRYSQVKVRGTLPGEWTIVDSIDKEFKTKTVDVGSALRGTIDGLQRNSYYELSVVAVNSEGESEEARMIVKTSTGAEGAVDEEGGKGEGEEASEDDRGDKKKGGEAEEEEGGEKDENDGGDGARSSKDGSASAGLGSGIVIGIIVAIIILIFIIALVIYFIIKRKPQLVGKLRGKGCDEERGKAEAGKEAAEEEKLIQKDDKVKVENEIEEANKDDVVEAKPKEFEPDTKPGTPAEAPADKPAEVPATEVKPQAEITVTPPENSTA